MIKLVKISEISESKQGQTLVDKWYCHEVYVVDNAVNGFCFDTKEHGSFRKTKTIFHEFKLASLSLELFKCRYFRKV